MINNDQKADRALRRIAEIEAERQEFKAFYEEQIRKLNTQCDYERNGIISALRAYFDTLPVKPTKAQAAYRLPSGKLVRKFEKPKLEYDAAGLIERLDGTEFVEYKPNLRWGEYKKRLATVEGRAVDAETGEVIEGVWVGVSPETFDVEV